MCVKYMKRRMIWWECVRVFGAGNFVMDNIYAVQQDAQSVLMIEFYSSLMLARHVWDLSGPSSGAFYKLYLQICYVVIRVLLDTSSPLLRNGEVRNMSS